MFEKTIEKWVSKNLSPIHSDIQNNMFEIKDKIEKYDEKAGERITKTETEIKKINEKIEAIIECIRGDRKDINALINIYKSIKQETKRKK